MISYQIIEHGKPLQKVFSENPKPVGSEVLMRVTRSGVCHSDLHIWEGFFDLGGGKRFYVKERGCVPPFTLGHEPFGIVEALGPKAKGVKVGQKRLIHPWIGCGKCAVCKAGQENYCVSGTRILGVNRAGAYSTHLLVPDARYLLDAAGIDEAFAATLACSGVTAYSASAKLPPLTSTDRVAIIGCGGVGMAGIAVLRAKGVKNIVACDIDDAKLKGAARLGAKLMVNTRSADAAQQLQGIAGAIDFVGTPATAALGIAALRKGGRYVLVGLHGGELTHPLPPIAQRAIGIVGSYVGSLQELKEVVALAKKGKLKPMPVETRAAQEVNRALDDLQAGRVVGRVVLDFERIAAFKRKSADSTAQMSRSQVAAAQAKARAGAFVWPAPPYYEFSDPAAAADGADCLLIFRDGSKSAGVLLNFFPDTLQLRFRAAGAADPVSIAFASLFGVQLRRPVEIRRQPTSLDDTAELYSAAERQPFAMRLVNGNAFQGETVGSVHALCGVFLFPPDRDGAVTRWFVPADATQAASIGKPIGEMLVEEKLATPEDVDAALSRQAALRSRRFGEYLTDNQIVSPEQLAAALKQQRSQPIQKLGETLVELGYLTESELDAALAIEARDRSIPLGQILADMGVVDAEVVNAVIARKLGIPYISLKTFRIPPELLKRIPAAVAQRFQALPVAESDNALAVAIENPMDMAKLDELRFIVGSKLLPVMASGEDIRSALERAYGERVAVVAEVRRRSDVGIGELTHRLAAETADADLDEQQSVEQDNTLVQLVNKMIIDAAEQKASDIHIEANPGGKDLRVRFRKDGALVTYLDLPARFRKAVVSRLKIMAQLDITERRKPQDGKIEFRRFGPLDVDLRMATIPTTGGLEDIVMRVLAAATPVALDALGFDPQQLQALKRLIARPHGLFLVCGPTGSGKTTTLHSLLRELNTADLKIWTAEDPIEIVQPGLRQVQVNSKIGWTFAAAMRSFMRADPDVIMVGEMRDAETAKTGIEASLTGHLVFSTLHTNSAVESVVRLLDLGMDPFNFADALLGVLAQRLVRKLCADCRVAYSPERAELEELASEYSAETHGDPGTVLSLWRARPTKLLLHRAKGCARCDRTGYKGRLAVYELLVADAAVKRLVQTRAPVSEIAAIAALSGLHTLKQSAIDKVIEGHTDLQQVRTITA